MEAELYFEMLLTILHYGRGRPTRTHLEQCRAYKEEFTGDCSMHECGYKSPATF